MSMKVNVDGTVRTVSSAIQAKIGDKLYILWRYIKGYIFTSDGYAIQTSDGYMIKCSDQ